jgi:hypothetical protein
MSIVQLDVGGRLFRTTEATLLGKGSRFFISALRDEFKPDGVVATKEGLFIDRDGDLFDPLLAFLRTGVLRVRSPLRLTDVLAEAHYYGLEIAETAILTVEYGRLIYNEGIIQLIWSSSTTEQPLRDNKVAMADVNAFLQSKLREGWVVESCGQEGPANYGEKTMNAMWWMLSREVPCSLPKASSQPAPSAPRLSTMAPMDSNGPTAPRFSTIQPLVQQEQPYAPQVYGQGPPHVPPPRSGLFGRLK